MMGITVLLGFAGTLLFFYGLRYIFNLIIKSEKRDRRLHVFNARQLQENVVRQSGTMAVSSLLILGALCCFGAGVAIAVYYGQSDPHVLDYTFIPNIRMNRIRSRQLRMYLIHCTRADWIRSFRNCSNEDR